MGVEVTEWKDTKYRKHNWNEYKILDLKVDIEPCYQLHGYHGGKLGFELEC